MERNFEGSLFIRHAGLVIVAPYLEMLFTRLGYLEDNVFVNPAQQMRAVHLLAHIASHEEIVSEPEMVLHKVLCGMPLHHLVDFSIELTSEEINMADSMLDAVISNWTKIIGTSREGLKTSFIDREGKLEEDQEGFYLKVEQKSIDVLLDSIPWNIQHINLSWMDKMINVLWR